MDLYTGSLILGALGLGLMAVIGLQHQGGSHAGHGHAGHGHGHGGHGHAGHAAGHGQGGHASGHAAHIGPAKGDGIGLLGPLLMTPRILFAFALGFGAAGLVLRAWFGGLLLLGIALAVGIMFERLIIANLWRATSRFESQPALTLESALDSEATVVSAFDRDGHGLVSVEMDGQVVQLLGRLRADDRDATRPLRMGDRVRVDEIDTARNRCTVSRLG